MNVDVSAATRQKALDWLNSKTKDTAKGVEILKNAGYKPYVIEIFEKNIDRKDIPAKVEIEIRNYVRYHANPDNVIHKDELKAEVLPLSFTDTVTEQFVSKVEVNIQENQYPELIAKAMYEFAELYNQRSILHKELKQIGEANTDKEIKARKQKQLVINACSIRMDELHNIIEAYKLDKTMPAEEVFAEKFNPEAQAKAKAEQKETDQVKTFELADDIVGLKKQSENWRIKISRAENMLRYQQETKPKTGEKTTPMPEGPKRIKKLKTIERMKAEKLQIETAIANLA